MEYKGIIREINFMPMVEGVASIMRLTVDLPNKVVTTENSGSIKQLSQKFGFEIVDEHTWDMAGIKGQKCIVRETDDGFVFVSYTK